MKWTLPSRREIRHASIGVAVAAAFLVGGAILFKDSGEAALEAVGLAGIALALVVSHTLEALAGRRDRRRGGEPQ